MTMIHDDEGDDDDKDEDDDEDESGIRMDEDAWRVVFAIGIGCHYRIELYIIVYIVIQVIFHKPLVTHP